MAGGGETRIPNYGEESSLGWWQSGASSTAKEEVRLAGGRCGRMLVDGVVAIRNGVHLAAVPFYDDVPFHEWTKCHGSVANQ